MNHLDRYKKRLLKDDNAVILQRRIEETNDSINLNFTTNSGYRRAMLKENIDEEAREIDVFVNSKTDGLQKDINFRPNTIVKVGSYVTYNDMAGRQKTYIIREIECDDNTPTALGFLCNRELNFKNYDKAIPCYTNSTTYGSKGVSDQEKFYELDSKTKIYIQRNRITETMKVGMRIMFGNKYVYKITEFDDLVFPGMYTIVAQRDEINSMDDLENNIAWNSNDIVAEDKPSDGQSNIEIVGTNKVKLGETSIYSIITNVDWEVDDESIAEIVSYDDRQITLKGKKRGFVTLIGKNENNEFIKDIMVV